MSSQFAATAQCVMTGELHPIDHMIRCDTLEPPLIAALGQTYSGPLKDAWISQQGMLRLRMRRVESDLEKELGELTAQQREVMDALQKGRFLATDPLQDMDMNLSPTQKLADKIAAFGGSWTFILSFLFVLTAWIILNSGFLLARPFDPFPFILMNLILSCVAALQAPVIMMSQNRQESKDRARSEHDYQINLKAELEIRALREQMDRFTSHQWSGLLEIQRIQMEMLEAISLAHAPNPGSGDAKQPSEE